MESPIYFLTSVLKAKTEDLEDFTGPLDLILHLLSKNKMEIQDIQLSLILEQYLIWMSKRQELDLEVASDFVIMASHLVDIKTRMLISVDDTEASSEMDELIATLEAHRNNETYVRIKKATPQLELQYRQGQNLFTKPPEVLEKEEVFIYNHATSDLKRAMLSIFSRMDIKKPVEVEIFQGIVGKETYAVEDKSKEIIAFLVEEGSSQFAILIGNCRSKSEAVATFLSVLVLCKNNYVTVLEEEDDYVIFYVENEGNEALLLEDLENLEEPKEIQEE